MTRTPPILLALLLALASPAGTCAAPEDPAPSNRAEPTPSERAEAARAERDRLAREAIDLVLAYHAAPQPDRIADAVPALLRSRELRDWNNAATVVGFLMEIFRRHPDRVEAWFDAWTTLRRHDRYEVPLNALATSRIPNAEAVLSAQIDGADPDNAAFIMIFLNEERPDPLGVTEIQSIHVAMCWGAYCASADERYLDRMLEFMVLEREDTLPADTALTISFGAAVDPSVREWAGRRLAEARDDPMNAPEAAGELEFLLEDARRVHENRAEFGLTPLGVPVWVAP